MIVKEIDIPGAYIITPEPYSDERGWFMRSFCKETFEQAGLNSEWMQMNHSYTKERGSIRGMHFQYPPYAEIKTVRCIAGAVYDVLVDLRKDSPRFLRWTGIELSAQNKKTIYIPKGVAHGFQVLIANSELLYSHSEAYRKTSEGGILYNDPAINIEWPLSVTNVSHKDLSYDYINENFKVI